MSNWFLPFRPPANTGFLSNGATCFSFRLKEDQDPFWKRRLLSSVRLGNLIPLTLWLFTKRKTKAKLQRLEEGDPEELLRESENNFKLHLAEIRDAAIEAPAFFQTSGKAGRLNLSVRHGEKIKCEFDDVTEMNEAIHLLAPLLSSTLKVNVEWNGEKQQFERKKTI